MARRRTREQARAEYLAATDPDDVERSDIFNDPAEPAPPPARPSLFKMPNIRQDIGLLPGMFRSKPLLFVPLFLLLLGVPLFILRFTNQLSPDVAGIATYYLQFFFLPPALFTFFVAGFLAPRASYLVGFVYGIIAAALWTVAFLAVPIPADDPTLAAQPTSPIPLFLNVLAYGLVYGTLAAALAAWYRDFLRGIQERGRARRLEREGEERAKRREERQEARRVAKQRPTS